MFNQKVIQTSSERLLQNNRYTIKELFESSNNIPARAGVYAFWWSGSLFY